MTQPLSIPLSMTTTGAVPTPPATLRSDLVTTVATQVPGYTASLPGSLIEDVASTITGAMVQMDQSRVDAVNSVTPYGANASILAQLGVMFGLPLGQPANGSAFVVFSGTAGYTIPPGFLVSDGSNQYAVQSGTVVQASGSSPQVSVIATSQGTFPIPAGAINQIATSVPAGYTLTVTNPEAGVPASSAETVASYRGRIFQAWQASATGTPAYLKTLLEQIIGVQPRLVSVIQGSGGWEVICGGGDEKSIANAILQSVPDISRLVGSTTASRNVTVSLFQNPNTYSIVFVNPPPQVVTLNVTWNTLLPNFSGASLVNQAAQTAIQSYINSIPVGQPINLLELNAVFQNAASQTIDAVSISTLTYVVTINGTAVTPTAGTSTIPSDPESYFSAAVGSVVVTQG